MLDRTVAPPFVQSTSFDLIKPETKSFDNGVKLFYVLGGSQDVLKVEFVFNAGRWYESTWGASYFTSHLLSKGTKQKSSFEIARILDLYGAHLEVNPGLDFVSIALYALGKSLSPALDVIQEILLEPSFPEKELDLTRSIYLQNLKVNEEKTSFLASKYFRKILFGGEHPYGKEIEESDVSKISPAVLQNHFQSLFSSPAVFVSGNVSETNAAQIESALSKWSQKPPHHLEHKANKFDSGRQIIDKEGSVQSSLRMGNHAVSRNHPDYTALIFTSHILGGYFGSRLMKNIREEKGLTYGIYSSVQPLKHGSYIGIGADVNKENTELAFSEIRNEINRLRTEAVSAEELQTAKSHFIGSLQAEINNPFAHADKIKTLFLFDLPSAYYQNMIRTISNMSAEDIIRVSNQYLNEEEFFELAIG